MSRPGVTVASFILTFIVMFVFWVLLSGFFDAFHLVSGIICSLLVAAFSHDLLVSKNVSVAIEGRRLIRFLRYLPWLIYEIIKANIDVARLTLAPRMPITPRVVKIKTSLRTELGIVTFANSITLTPGTVTVAATRDGEFLVHAITKEAADALTSGDMQRRVEAIEDIGKFDEGLPGGPEAPEAPEARDAGGDV